MLRQSHQRTSKASSRAASQRVHKSRPVSSIRRCITTKANKTVANKTKQQRNSTIQSHMQSSLSTAFTTSSLSPSSSSLPLTTIHRRQFSSHFEMPVDDTEFIHSFIPAKFRSLLQYNFDKIPVNMPEMAWDASVRLFSKTFAIDQAINLLSDIDNATKPETVNEIKRLFPNQPDMTDNIDIVKFQKEQSKLERVQYLMDQYLSLRLEVEDLALLIQEAYDEMNRLRGNILTDTSAVNDEIDSWQNVVNESDHDMQKIKTQATELEEDLLDAILPEDEADSRNAILEVRPGAGGDEAALFTREIFHMYEKFAQNNNMRFTIDSVTEFDASNSKGYKEGVASITGQGVFGFLKHETGVHRVQRIPATESMGRVHTSTVTVAFLPEATEIDVQIKPADIRIDLFRAGGAGGQHVNTTDSAVRITHLPTGIVVQNQDQRNQHKNKEKAMSVLRARIFDQQRQEQAAERARLKGAQIGTGDRNERIRTYNFPQSRVTDHRINLTLSDIDGVMQGEGLELFSQKLRLQERLDILLSMNNTGGNAALKAATDKKKK